jgi:protein-S-isoprenylcysteine O-methyltransferase Ste14
MSEQSFHAALVWAFLGLAALIAATSVRIVAPYGRFGRTAWSGPDLPSWAAWMLMEIPQPVGMAVWFVLGGRHANVPALVFLGMWMFHYAYRTFIYPFLPRSSTMSLSVVAAGFVLNVGFSYLNGRWLFSLGPERSVDWLWDPRFVLGALMFFGGFALATTSDAILRGLRAPGEKRYVIPRGGGFLLVSSPNYLGEILEWLGWSLATFSLSGLTIAAVSAANLVPRALRNHRWYRDRFPDYPKGRRALIPYVL